MCPIGGVHIPSKLINKYLLFYNYMLVYILNYNLNFNCKSMELEKLQRNLVLTMEMLWLVDMIFFMNW